MGVGPPGRSGRDQVREVQILVDGMRNTHKALIVFVCRNAIGDATTLAIDGDTQVVHIDCAGSLHTAALEFALRRGVAGVAVAHCAPRDCLYREGPQWLEDRVYHGREAELKPRVDRRRVRLIEAMPGGWIAAAAELRAFRRELSALTPSTAESRIEIDTHCEEDPLVGT
jgi:coenzyme F420-reducing hydrogenase delta subunit